ncbi:MAG TPA: SusC/RagA family TonB-linked outer membrane protein, partial [Fodinibius sp.]|nr:SusC/RagA family TonB-linked outer membrane protein [Fodinibius sp.]
VEGALAQQSSQTERDFAPLEWYASNEGSASIYGEDISVSFEEVPLIQAINELANQIGVRLSYNQKELPNKKITLVTDNISVIQAFKKMFQATGLNILASPSGQIVIKKNTTGVTKVNVAETVSGKVTDAETGDLLPGVNIAIKGTSSGTSTSGSGTFELEVPSLQGTLVFSFIGYTTKEVPLRGRSELNVQLQPKAIQGEEVVVVDYGYGTVNRADFTGSVSSMSGEVLEKIPVSNAAEAINGRLPGVRVLSADGAPGAENVITIRGGGSITQSNEPLYIVDGFVVGSIRDIPPSDIISIDVLKDAAATALYGAQASNGVIVINTKKPQAGKINVSYNNYVQYNKLPSDRKYDVLSPYGYVMANYEQAKLRSEADLRNFEKYYGKYDDLELYKAKPSTNWQEELFGDPQLSQYHNLSINGGTEYTKMVLSLSHNDEDGLLVGSGYRRSTINFKLNQRLANSLQMDVSTRITNTRIDGSGTSGSSQIRIKDAITRRPVNGIAYELDIDLTDIDNDDEYQSFLLNMINPRDLAEQDWRKRTENSYVFNAGLTWDPMDNMILKSTFTTKKYFGENLRFYGPLTGESRQEGNSLPLGTKSEAQDQSYRWLNTVKYVFNNFDKHDLDILVGQEIYSTGGKDNFVRVENFRESMLPDELFANMALGNLVEQSTSRSTNRNRFSVFAGSNYQYDDRYLLTATIRADASSKFKESNRLGFFPAAALGWKITNESFMEGAEFVDRLKLRLSYGITGNDRISATASQFLFSPSTYNGPGMGTNDYNAYYSPSGSTLYNPNLIWESTIQKNIGLDFGFWDSKINGSLDLYHNTTKDLLLKSAISPVSGFSTQWNNIGSTANKGIELGLNAYIIDKQNFTLRGNFNFAINRPKIVELDGTEERFYQSNWSSTDLKDRNDFYLKVGRSIGLM